MSAALRIAEPPVAASCTDAPRPLPINVELLSVGLPDGVYYAGKRLTSWMLFDDRMMLDGLYHGPHDTSSRAAFLALEQQRQNESLTVRWAIANGLASAPTVLTMKDHRATSSSRDRQPEFRDAFLWGRANHTDIYSLGHFLLDEVLRQPGHAIDTIGNQRSSNSYIEAFMPRVEAFGDDAWVISQREIACFVYEADLRRLRQAYVDARREAWAMGVHVEAVLRQTFPESAP